MPIPRLWDEDGFVVVVTVGVGVVPPMFSHLVLV